MEVFRSLAFRIESNLWTAGRVMFFPLLGMTALAWLLPARGPQPESERAALLRNWNASAILSFATGFAIAFFVSVGGFKWPLTRFLIPGVTLALVSLVLAADLAVRERRPRLQIALWATLVTVATLGPIVEFADLAQRQVAKAGAPDGLPERLRLLLEIHDMVPEGSPFPRL